MAEQYLGRSLTYPVTIDQYGKGTTVEGKDNVLQSIAILLDTPVGTKFFNPDYGSRIESLLFQPNTLILESLLRLYIKEAITQWIKTVAFQGVNFSYNEDYSTVFCEIQCLILASNQPESFIYPFVRKIKY